MNNLLFKTWMIISLYSCISCSGIKHTNMKENQLSSDKLASSLKESGYNGLFLLGNRSAVDSIWQDGATKESLLQIVKLKENDDYTRLLASEVLYAKMPDYPAPDLEDVLADIYSQALAISGQEDGALLSANVWGFMYDTDKEGSSDYGALGARLIKRGKKAVPYLTSLLDNGNTLVYAGSEEATVGKKLHYRVKDAAAYYLGKITGIPVKFYPENTERDLEIKTLQEKLKTSNGK